MIHFSLVTLDGTKFGEDVHEVILPTPQGYIAVFENHAPLVSLASPGIISVRRKENHADDMMEHFATNGGVIEVEGNGPHSRVLIREDAVDGPGTLVPKPLRQLGIVPRNREALRRLAFLAEGRG